MKKYLYAGLLAACLTALAVAAPLKLSNNSPDDPVHRRAIVLCMLAIVGLHAYKSTMTHKKQLAEQLVAAYRR